jgi:hypothetical protein
VAEFMTKPDIAEEYLKYTQGILDELVLLLAQLQAGKGRAADTNAAVLLIAHNIKGMGTSFEYDLMTLCGDSLCTYLRRLDPRTMAAPKVVAGHLKVMQSVISNQIRGDGGETGTALLARLKEIIDRETV